MSILIKGMEMPKTCHCCRMCVQVSDGDIDWHWECCLLCEKVERYATDRIPGCPIVPVPPHGRLGDLDELAKRIKDEGRNQAEYYADRYAHVVMAYGDCYGKVESAPTIIEEEK